LDGLVSRVGDHAAVRHAELDAVAGAPWDACPEWVCRPVCEMRYAPLVRTMRPAAFNYGK